VFSPNTTFYTEIMQTLVARSTAGLAWGVDVIGFANALDTAVFMAEEFGRVDTGAYYIQLTLCCA
jgi:hypothetical protein